MTSSGVSRSEHLHVQAISLNLRALSTSFQRLPLSLNETSRFKCEWAKLYSLHVWNKLVSPVQGLQIVQLNPTCLNEAVMIQHQLIGFSRA